MTTFPTKFPVLNHPSKYRRLIEECQEIFWARFGISQSGGSRYENGRKMPGPLRVLLALYDCGHVTDSDLVTALRLSQACPWKAELSQELHGALSSLAEYRRQKQESQARFWARFGVVQTCGSRYENGRPLPRPLCVLLALYASGRVTEEELAEAKRHESLCAASSSRTRPSGG